MSLFWLVQASSLLVLFVPFSCRHGRRCGPQSHFLRAIGLTLAYHRYFAHRAFKMGRLTQFVWSYIAASAMQKGPLWWAGHHVNHHKFADRDGDPHSPIDQRLLLRALRLVPGRRAQQSAAPDQPRRSRLRQVRRRLRLLDTFYLVPPLLLASVIYVYGGMHWLVVGLLLPTMTLAHATFAINTMNHLYGSRRFRHRRRIAQQRDHGAVCGRRGLAQQPPPLSAGGAQRLLLVGVRCHLVRDLGDEPCGLAWDVQPVPERIYREARAAYRDAHRSQRRWTPGLDGMRESA